MRTEATTRGTGRPLPGEHPSAGVSTWSERDVDSSREKVEQARDDFLAAADRRADELIGHDRYRPAEPLCADAWTRVGAYEIRLEPEVPRP